MHSVIKRHSLILHEGFAYLQDVTLSQAKAACRNVDAFPFLHLNVIDALVVVLVIQRIVGGQENAGVL